MRLNLLLLVLIAALEAAEFYNSIWVVYLETRHHIPLEMFLLIEGVFTLSMVMWELPSSWLSDLWRRKQVLLLGAGLNLVSWLLLLNLEGIWVVIVAQLMIGVGYSMFSGTVEALMYESLKALRRESEYAVWYGRQAFLIAVVGGTATLAGGFLYAWKVDAPVYAMVAVSVVVLMLVLMLTEPLKERGPQQDSHWVGGVKRVMADMWNQGLRRPLVLRLMVFNAMVFGTLNVLYWLNQPYFKEVGLSPEWFAVLLCVESMLGGVGAWVAARVSGGWLKVYLPIVLMLAAVVLVAAWWLPFGYVGAGLLVGIGLLWGFGSTLLHSRLQMLAPDTARATVTSATSLLFRGWFFGFSAVASVVTGWYGLRGVFMMGALVMGLVGLLVVFGYSERAPLVLRLRANKRKN